MTKVTKHETHSTTLILDSTNPGYSQHFTPKTSITSSLRDFSKCYSSTYGQTIARSIGKLRKKET